MEEGERITHEEESAADSKHGLVKRGAGKTKADNGKSSSRISRYGIGIEHLAGIGFDRAVISSWPQHYSGSRKRLADFGGTI